MAITYHAGRRLQGLSTEGISTVTFEDDDFAGWTVQSRASVTAGVLFTPDSNYANAHITHSFKTYAIGEPDDMVLNWDWKFSGLKLPFIIIGSEASAGQASSSNAGGYGNPTEGNKKIIIKNNDQTLDLNFRSYKTGGSNFNEDANSSTATTTNGVMYYYQFIKDGYDISVKRYGSIADRTSQTNAQQTVTDTWNAGSTTGGWTDTADLAYIVIGSYGNYQNVGFANAGSNYMYDFKLYSGVTSVATEVQRPTNVQVGSRFEETDTRKMYHYGTPDRETASAVTKISLTGLTAYYTFEQTSGTMTNQASTIGSSSQITADGTFETYGSSSPNRSATGHIGTYATFFGGTADAVGSRYNLSGNPVSSTCSISLWLKAGSGHLATTNTIIGTYPSGSGWQITTNPGVGFSFYQGGNQSWNYSYDKEVWTHIVVTRSGSTYQFYLDGVLKTATGTGANGSTLSGNPSIGSDPGSGSNRETFGGTLDDMSIWNRVLTSSEITTLYSSGYGRELPAGNSWKEEGT